MKIQRLTARLAISTILGAFGIFNTFGQTSAFSYQGKLTDAGVPANGAYIMQFGLWNAATSGTSIGILSDLNVNVRDGVFNVQLDFGAAAISGNDLYLEVSVKKLPGDTYTTLTPRQQILSAPHAIKSGTAGSSEDSAKLGGVDAARFVQSDANGNVTLIGNLTVAGSTTYDTVNAATQFNLGGNRVLTSDGSGNLVLGSDTGTAPTPKGSSLAGPSKAQTSTGVANTFLGNLAGFNNTSGSRNTFAGQSGGFGNTTGGSNTFIGAVAGFSNTIGGYNSFFGDSAGWLNTLGSNNVFLGTWAGSNNTSGNRNTISGFNSGGGCDVFPCGFDMTGNDNSFYGYVSGLRATTGSQNSYFGMNSGLNNQSGSNNSFFGAKAGQGNTADDNSFFGSEAGLTNTSGQFNSFFGRSAGQANTTGMSNSLFGYHAGFVNTTGSFNAFFGLEAGSSNTTGQANSFFGLVAGSQNTIGNYNAFFGGSAGQNNVSGERNSFFGISAGANSLGSLNSFVVNSAGLSNTNGSNNTLIGAGSDVASGSLTNATAIGGGAVVSQSNSVVLGNNANVGIGTSAPTAKLEVVGDAKVSGAGNGVIFPDGTKQTTAATGAGTVVTSVNGLNNAVTLAAGPNVTITPAGNTLTIAAASSPAGILNQTSQQAGANFNIDGTGTANKFDATQYNSYGIRILATPPESYNLLVGFSAGSNLRFGVGDTLVGFESGLNTTDGSDNAIFGSFAGRQLTTGGGNTFLGTYTGGSVTTGGDNTLVGDNAGDGLLTGTNSTALGRNAKLGPNVSFATAIGAGALATTDNTIVIGRATDTVTIPGTLTKAAGSFRIDHPLDPYNKYLFHSFVESPDMMNVYNGNITTDANGEATVLLPGYFEALNKDVRYQLTVIGTFAQAIISEEVSGNKFKIRTDKPNVKVSWQVTGIRKDPYAEKNRIVPEVEKPASEKGKLQNPDVYGEKP